MCNNSKSTRLAFVIAATVFGAAISGAPRAQEVKSYAPASDGGPQKTVQFRELKVDPQTLPSRSRDALTLESDGQGSKPFADANSMIVQFEPGVTDAQKQEFLQGRDLKVIQTFETINAVKVETDLSQYFKPRIGDDNVNQSVIRGLIEAKEDFEKDPRVKAAAPDTTLRDQTGMQVTNLLKASDKFVTDLNAPGEKVDWGIADIEADKLWSMPGADDGVIFGVLDVGFGRHEDLVFIELPSDMVADDHGNHVAAIGCGRHGNSRGVKGVLPNCLVRARAADVFFQSTEGGQVLRFFVLFSQILATLENFVQGGDEVRTFNISLGYNWRSNFGINPDLPENGDWRALVASQGTLIVSLLEKAAKKDKILFSAAGNDSDGLATPILAKFASPFNWAAITAREQGIHNGVIVEAHDSNGQRASFSNAKGDLSCPGVNVLSAVAFDPVGGPSKAAYGQMSGTSMASPYCAAGHLLVRLVRPQMSGEKALECMLKSSDRTNAGTPMLRLTQALGACDD